LSAAEGALLGFYMWSLQFWTSNPMASATTYLQLHKFLQLDHLDASTWGCISFASACALAEVHALHSRGNGMSKDASHAFPTWTSIVFTQAAPNNIADFGGCALVCACRCGGGVGVGGGGGGVGGDDCADSLCSVSPGVVSLDLQDCSLTAVFLVAVSAFLAVCPHT